MQTLSVAFLVKNPPMDRFALLIEYLRFIANEIVIVDTGSVPDDINTMQGWSNRFADGVKVIQAEWEDDFSKARNIGLSECHGDWTLVLDPDEIPSVGMSLHILSILRGENDRHSAVGWLYWTVNYWGGVKGPEENYHWHCRLFRTGRGQFYRRVHELVMLDGKKEAETRGTATLPLAPPMAYLIHSKGTEDLQNADDLYERLGRISR
jgi:hypothetical protein